MTFTQINYFIAVADAKNVSRAAETCCISQSAMSRQIALLEEELGFMLMRRTQHGITLTKAGQTIYESFVHMLAELNTSIEKAAEQDRVTRETLMLGTLDAWDIDTLYEDFFAGFRRTHPKLEVQCTLYHLGELQNALEKGHVHLILTLRESLVERKYLQIATIAPIRPSLQYSHSHRLAKQSNVSLADCDGEALSVTTERNLQAYFARLFVRIAAAGGKLQPRPMPNYPSILREARNGQCLMLTDSFGQQPGDEFLQIPLDFTDHLCLAWINSSRMVQQFVQAFMAYYQNKIGMIGGSPSETARENHNR